MTKSSVRYFLVAALLTAAVFASHSNAYLASFEASSAPLIHRVKRNSTQASSISQAVKNLKPGQLPQASTSGGNQVRSSVARQQALHNDANDVQTLPSKTESRFMAKHLFESGKYGESANSFELFSTKPEYLKKYIFELHRKAPGTGVLFSFSVPKDLINGMKQMNKKSLTFIDVDIDALNAEFENWLNHGGTKGASTNFETTKKYRVTHVTYEPKEIGKNAVEVVVNMEQREVRLSLGTNAEGNINHFDGMVAPEQSAIHNEKKGVITLTQPELREVLKRTDALWKALGVQPKTFPKENVLDDQSQRFKDLTVEFDKVIDDIIHGRSTANSQVNPKAVCRPAGRRRRAAGACAIFVGDDDKVERILPEEFVEAYKDAGEEEKRKLTELAKENMDRIVDEDPTHSAKNRKEISKLIQLENTKSHVTSMDTVSNIHDMKTGSSHNDFSEAIENLHDKLLTVKSRVKLSSSKLSKKIAHYANTEAAKHFGRGIASMSDSFGKFFLAKTIITGIIHGDTTTLAIVGGRIGYDVATEAGVYAGTKFFSGASKVGKFAKGLGKVAGPIGAVADLGLGIWSLTKSVGRLKNATNKFDRDDAIADVVTDSVDLAVTATVLTVSVIFPPAAPVAMVVGLVITLVNQVANALFKASNEVARINSEIPLLDSEKEYVFTSRLFDLFGTRGQDYLDYLVEEKGANDIAVQHNLQILKDNPSIYGIAFPSRTLSYDGGCELFKQYCSYNWGELCWNWETKERWGSGCDRNKPCDYELCTSHRQTVNSGYNQFTCECNKNAETTFGFPRTDSFVDFREKQNIYWERAVPKDVEGADFKCKPGSSWFRGYMKDQEESRGDYLCEDAIALLQPAERRKEAIIMLFDLLDGSDKVYAGNDAQSNLFRVGNGTKYFVGGYSSRNEFLFDEDCQSLSGTLVGGDNYQDALTVLKNCSKGQWMEFDFETGQVRNQDGNLGIAISLIDEINGRENEQDILFVGCDLRKAMLGGGAKGNPDKIKIRPRENCKYNFTAVLGDFTEIESTARSGAVTLLLGSSFKSVSATLDIYKPDSQTLQLVFLSTASSQVNIESIIQKDHHLSLNINKIGTGDSMAVTLNVLREQPDHPIYFTETPSGSPDSILMLHLDSPPVFYHSLTKIDTKAARVRSGCTNTANFFDITGENWRVIGGDQDDQFILHSPHFTSINGKGGIDTLTLHKDIKSDVTIDLTSKIQYNNLEIVNGIPGQQMTVVTECSTKTVASMGGPDSKPDVVHVPAGLCSQRELKIVVIGNTKVEIASEMGPPNQDNITVVVPSSKAVSIPVKFQMEVKNGIREGLMLAIQVSHVNWEAELELKPTENMFWVRLNDINRKEMIDLSLPTSNGLIGELPYVDISKSDSDEPSGRLLINEDKLILQVLFDLQRRNELHSEKSISGYIGISNAFRIESGSWETVGGSRNDIFAIFSDAQMEKQSIDGNDDDTNLLILESNSEQKQIIDTYGVNLETRELGFLMLTEKGSIKNIQQVVGRSNLPDVIHGTCDTSMVNGRGGAGEGKEDLIFISGNNCREDEAQAEIHVEKFTKLVNTARYGSFKYLVNDITTSEMKLNATETNEHLIKFGFHPWEQIDSIKFNEDDKKLGFWSGNKLVTFQMSRINTSIGYTNPIFQFHKPDFNVTADVQVSKDGIVSFIFGIHEGGLSSEETVQGLNVDVNRYLINVTETRSLENVGGSIEGSSSTRVNQFWIFELQSVLNVLDGGNCIECKNYLHLVETFGIGSNLEIKLSKEEGFMKCGDKPVIKKLTNIHELRGRGVNGVKDKVVISSCDVRQVSEVEEISIIHDEQNDCTFSLTMEIGENTSVWFEDPSSKNSPTGWTNSTFHYRFTSPRSFNLNGSSSFAWLGPIHNFYLPFTVDDLEWISFDLEEQSLNYSIAGKAYQHDMILGASYKDAFFSQPSLITQDKFKIQIGRDGSILLTMGAGSSFPSDKMTTSILPTFHSAAKRLGVSFILQTDTQFLYVAHGNIEGSRNVLQNVDYSVSYLGGGGADDTIYDLAALSKDVFIYPGFDSSQTSFNTPSKQSLDLTDIVIPIRRSCSKKYLPKVLRNEDDLLISMEGYSSDYPGHIYIAGGAQQNVSERMQVLLGHAIMDIVEDPVTKDWKIRPRPILIPEGTVYTIAKEDVEDDHEIHIIENGASIRNATFKCMKNGTDLFVTNIIAEVETDKPDEHAGHFEITTIIITDFYEDGEANPTLPNTVSGVTLMLPGLTILLEGKQVVPVKEYMLPRPTNYILQSQPMETVPILEWNFVLHEVEEFILNEYPDIPREFDCQDNCPKVYVEPTIHIAEISPAFPWDWALGVIGACVTLLVLGACILFQIRTSYQPNYEKL